MYKYKVAHIEEVDEWDDVAILATEYPIPSEVFSKNLDEARNYAIAMSEREILDVFDYLTATEAIDEYILDTVALDVDLELVVEYMVEYFFYMRYKEEYFKEVKMLYDENRVSVNVKEFFSEA